MEIEQSHPEMKHLQMAKKHFQLVTDHSGHNEALRSRKLISAHHDSRRHVADVPGELQDFPPLLRIFQHALAQ
jgi:hypothetical protein